MLEDAAVVDVYVSKLIFELKHMAELAYPSLQFFFLRNNA